MDRIFGISYVFTEMPRANELTEANRICYNPVLVYCQKDREIKTMSSLAGFCVNFRSVSGNDWLLPGKKGMFLELQKNARACQERIIAEYICTVILEALREFPGDDLSFLIHDEFHTEKMVGRLGYLGLPLERVHIMFVSRNLSDLMTNYIEQYAIPPKTDLHLLFQENRRGKVWGPYPDDAVISMLRTYFCSFFQEDIYPVRINLFSQFMSQDVLNGERERIRCLFLSEKLTEVYEMMGGRQTEKTRLPRVLVDCEEYVENEKRKR